MRVAGGTSRRAHLNAVVMDESGRYAIASLRHQDAVVKVPEFRFHEILLQPSGDIFEFFVDDEAPEGWSVCRA